MTGICERQCDVRFRRGLTGCPAVPGHRQGHPAAPACQSREAQAFFHQGDHSSPCVRHPNVFDGSLVLGLDFGVIFLDTINLNRWPRCQVRKQFGFCVGFALVPGSGLFLSPGRHRVAEGRGDPRTPKPWIASLCSQ